MKLTHSLFTFFCAAGLTTAVQADLPAQTLLPLDLAQKAANHAIKVCHDKGFTVSATVVDKSGVVQSQLRGNGGGTHTLESSRKKAFTAASMGRATSGITEAIAKNPALEGLRDMDPNLVFLPGGLPIKAGQKVIAGIGVGGAPSGMTDEECAMEAIKFIEKELS